jgi:hypothetical protein
MERLPLIVAGALFLSGCAASEHRLRITEDSRFLEYETGEPFLYLGDTAWELFHKLDREEADVYLEDRAAKGFTVIQAVILSELDGLRRPNAYGELPLDDLNPMTPNPAYFEHVDYIVSKAETLGLVMGVLPTWGDKVPSKNPGAGPLVFTPDNARSYGRFLGARYKDKPVIWILEGDRTVDSPEAMAIWRAMAEGLEEGHGNSQLMTFHPRGNSSSSAWFHDDYWLDFNMIQSGHDRRYRPTYRMIESDLTRRPAKPVIDGEPAYESIPVAFWDYVDFSKYSRERVPDGVLDEDGLVADESHFERGFFDVDDVRVHLYWTLFSGAAGYTYGANAVWQMFERGGEVAIPAREDWREALELPGAADVGRAGQLFSFRPLSDFAPDQSQIFGANPEGREYARALKSRDGKTTLVYKPSGDLFSVTRSGESEAKFFHPRTGEITQADCDQTTEGLSCFSPAPSSDFVLIVDQSGAYP